MVAIMMLAIKARRELRVSSLIDSGGPGFMRMSTEQSRTTDGVSFMEGGKKKPLPMMVMTPLQLVHLDLTSFKMTTNLNESPKIKHVLVIVDHFMRNTRAYVI